MFQKKNFFSLVLRGTNKLVKEKKNFSAATWLTTKTRKNVSSQPKRFYATSNDTPTNWTDVLFGFGLGLFFSSITR